MQVEMQCGENLITLRVETDGDGWRVWLPDGSEQHIQVSRRPDDVLQIAVTDRPPPNSTPTETIAPAGERVFRVPFARQADGLAFAYNGETYTFHAPTVRAVNRKGPAATGILTAPLSGIVAEVLVTAGQTVEAYQPLVVLEAMKVMTTLEAPFAGVVTSLAVQQKQQIAHGAVVVEITPSV